MRLYDYLNYKVNNDWRSTLTDYEVDELTSCVCVDITNVATYWYSHPRQPRHLRDEYPCLMLPFDRMWFEYEVDTGVIGEPLLQKHRFGAIVHMTQETDDLYKIEAHVLSYHGGDDLLSMGGFGLRIDSAGRNIDGMVIFPNDKLPPADVTNIDIDQWIATVADIIFLALSFMHCKNVTLDSARAVGSRQQIRRMVRMGARPAEFKTIVIDPLRAPSPGKSTGEKRESHKSLHIARGHFAHYSDDKPLFGKYTGTFWRPAHVRGSEDAGKVFKDYKVKAAV